MGLEAIVSGCGSGPGDWCLTVAPLPGLGTGHTEDNAAVADGHGRQWQQEEAAEGEEVIGGLLPLSLEAAFGDTLSEGDRARSLGRVEQEQLEWSWRTIRTGSPPPTHEPHSFPSSLRSLWSCAVLSADSSTVPYVKGQKLANL